MFDMILTRLAPAALVGGVAVYALVTMIWLQPLVESRLAEKYLIPSCEAGLNQSERSTPVPTDPRRRELEAYIRMLEVTGITQIPGVDVLIQEARIQLRALKTSRRQFSTVERNTVCGCAANKAYEALNFPGMTLHVASGRTYNPTNLQQSALEQSTLQYALSGQCGALPWQ